jgi:streptomycin 6-kinase
VDLPPRLTQQWRADPAWLESLPGIVAKCAELWNLELEAPVDTPHSLVVPAGDVVLKVNAPSHFEADHEADALERWGGLGAVRLVARDDALRAFLCERCRPGSHLSDSRTDETEVAAELILRLRQVPAEPHPFRTLAGEADRWLHELPARSALGERPFERRLIDLALDVFRTVDRTAGWLANQDLHGLNVLRAQREPWLVIDPKPLVGERELDGVGLLRNAGSIAAARRRLDVLAGTGLDRERLRLWGIAHTLAWGWDEHGWSETNVHVARLLGEA